MVTEQGAETVRQALEASLAANPIPGVASVWAVGVVDGFNGSTVELLSTRHPGFKVYYRRIKNADRYIVAVSYPRNADGSYYDPRNVIYGPLREASAYPEATSSADRGAAGLVQAIRRVLTATAPVVQAVVERIAQNAQAADAQAAVKALLVAQGGRTNDHTNDVYIDGLPKLEAQPGGVRVSAFSLPVEDVASFIEFLRSRESFRG
jgi:hypothetical protein